MIDDSNLLKQRNCVEDHPECNKKSGVYKSGKPFLGSGGRHLRWDMIHERHRVLK